MNNKDNKLIFEAYDDDERAFKRSMDNDIRTADADDRAQSRYEQDIDRELDAEDAAGMPPSHIGYDAEQTCQEIMKAASKRVGNKGVVYTVSGGDGTYGVFTNINDARAIEEETRGTIYEVPLNEYLPEGDLPVEM